MPRSKMNSSTSSSGQFSSFFGVKYSASMCSSTRPSITVKVEVYAERYRTQGQYIKVTEASVTYVAIDDNGQPREIPVRTL